MRGEQHALFKHTRSIVFVHPSESRYACKWLGPMWHSVSMWLSSTHRVIHHFTQMASCFYYNSISPTHIRIHRLSKKYTTQTPQTGKSQDSYSSNVRSLMDGRSQSQPSVSSRAQADVCWARYGYHKTFVHFFVQVCMEICDRILWESN